MAITSDTTLAEAVVKAVLASPGEGLAPVANSDIQLLSLELSSGVATVNLSIDARRLDPERLQILRAAVVNSLIELQDIQYVNLLIDDREECILQLPAGTMSRFDTDLTALWAQASTEDARYESTESESRALSRDITLYFGASGLKYLLPEVRAVRIEGGDYLGGVLSQLFKGPGDTLNYERILPSGNECLREKPEIIVDEYGNKIAVISFTSAFSDYLKRNQIPTCLAFGSIVRTVCG
ncbi:MAG: GerMN domain-containing protein, partial [Clostridia bacterium]